MLDRISLPTSWISTSRLVGMAFAIALGLTIVAGAALVDAQRGEPVESPAADAYQGCVNNRTGTLRIIEPGQQCQSHETDIQISGSASDAALLERIEALETTVENLQQANSDQQSEINALVSANVALQAQVPDCLTTDANDDAVFEGCNVHVRSGSGTTDGEINGKGNLIVGYNEIGTDEVRTGSHNLVVGASHSYSSWGGLIAGFNNTVSGAFSTVSGGHSNVASEGGSSVTGGSNNEASGIYSSVTGGSNNTASGESSSVGGGSNLVASSAWQFLP